LIIGYGKLTFGGGLSNLPAALKKIVAGRPGAITMSKETAMNCWEPYAGKVLIILQAGCFTPGVGQASNFLLLTVT
jgi:class I fructose-bisphosphate aldolase